LIFRKATIKDRSRLFELRMEFLKEANGRPYEFENRLSKEIRSYFNHHIKDESFIAWLCLNENKIVGTSGISFYEVPPSYNNHNGKVGYIMNMYTLKAFRRKGIATVLFEKMLEEGCRRNVGKFVLHATKNGQALYEKYGFVSSNNY
jgi:GNAT superfamily N-acetyltransferase